MNKQFQGFIAGVLATIILFSGALYAKSTVERIEVSYNNIQVYKDNVLQSLKDAQGNSIEPFVYQGTTYVPLRAAAELAGMQVRWDGSSKSIYLTGGQNQSSQPAQPTAKTKVHLFDVCKPQNQKRADIYTDGITLSGQPFLNGIRFDPDYTGYVQFDLKQQFSQLEASVGINHFYSISSKIGDPIHISFYLDGALVYSVEVKGTDTLPLKINFPVQNGSKLEIMSTATRNMFIGLGDITVY